MLHLTTSEPEQTRAARVAVAVALTLAIAKLAAGLIVNATAVLASAVDSLLDVFASTGNLLALRWAHSPPDQEHRFGHAKAEALATAGQALLIGGSAAYLIIEGAHRVIAPEPLRRTTIGLVVMAVSSIASAALVLYMRRAARMTGSTAIAADSMHYATDVLANLAVLAGIALTAATGLSSLDGFLTIAVAIYVAISALRLLRSATRVLMDEEIPARDRERIVESIRPFLGQIRSFHGMRTRAAANRVFVEIHLEMPGEMALRDAHALGVAVEAAICRSVPGAQVLVHLDFEQDEPPFVGQR